MEAESLRLPLLLPLLVWVLGVGVGARLDTGSSAFWPNSSSSSREIFRYGVSDPGAFCRDLRPRDELRESVSEPVSCGGSLKTKKTKKKTS